MDMHELLDEALLEARSGWEQGGIPIGAVLADRAGRIVARGRNMRVQWGDTTAHAETVCLRHAGRRRDWAELTMVSTLSPCIMCSGAIVLHRIGQVVIGENESFMGAEDFLRGHGVQLIHMNHPGCKALMAQMMRHKPELWLEDIGVCDHPDA